MNRTQTQERGFEGPLSRAPGEYAGYEVLDLMGQKIGRAEMLFFNENGWPEYVRVRIERFFNKLVLLPVQDVAPDGAARPLTLK